MNKHRVRRLFGALACICLVFFMTWFFTEFVGQRTEVEGMSMSPTLKDKENLILDKISYRFRDPKRYEIVVFPPKYKENTYYIKRVIGLPGETVEIWNGEVYIDGQRLPGDDSYGKIEDPGLAAEPFLLGEDERFHRQPGAGGGSHPPGGYPGKSRFSGLAPHGVWLSVQEERIRNGKKDSGDP